MHACKHPLLCSPPVPLHYNIGWTPYHTSVLFSQMHDHLSFSPNHVWQLTPTRCQCYNDRKACHANAVKGINWGRRLVHKRTAWWDHILSQLIPKVHMAPPPAADLSSYMLHYTRSTLPQQWRGVAQATCTKFNFYYTYVILNNLTHVASETLGRDIFHTYTLCAECLFRHVLYTEGHLLTLPISSLQLYTNGREH